MRVIDIPEEICNTVGTQRYTVDHIGESGSEVRIYDHYVLKIQPHSDETDNESKIVKWINYQLPIPFIPIYTVKNGIAYTLMSKVEGKCYVQWII